jgi:hypothetical protein
MPSGNLPKDNSGQPIPVLRPENTQQVAYTDSAATSSAVGSKVRAVRLVSTTNCFVAFGATADTNDMPLIANVPESFAVNPGETISAIREATDGTLYVTELS